MNNLGKTLRELRTEKGLLLREVASILQTDSAYVSKVELGERRAKREHLTDFARLYKTKFNELEVLWLADKVEDILKDEKMACKALEVIFDNLKKTA